MGSFIQENKQIKDLITFTQDSFIDNRGEIWTSYDKDNFKLPNFVQDKVSISKKNVIRGLHGDYQTGKLITCLSGECFLVVVDARKDSPTFSNIISFVLSKNSKLSVYVPPGCLNGHAVISEEDCTFFYKWTHNYTGPENQITVNYADTTLSIQWPVTAPILSDRDKFAPMFKEVIG